MPQMMNEVVDRLDTCAEVALGCLSRLVYTLQPPPSPAPPCKGWPAPLTQRRSGRRILLPPQLRRGEELALSRPMPRDGTALSGCSSCGALTKPFAGICWAMPGMSDVSA